MEQLMQNIPLDFTQVHSLNSFEKIDPVLKELFSIPISKDLEKIKSIIMIQNKGKNIVKLKFGKKPKNLRLKKSTKVYSIKRKNGKNLILVYDLDEDESSETKMIYAEILYEEENQNKNELYEDKFNPLNRYQHESILAPINLVEGEIKEKNYQEEVILYSEMPEIAPKVVIIEYETPLEAMNQDVYQRVFLRNNIPGITLYDSLFSSGLNIKTSYSERFDSVYVESINEVKDGDKNRFWEFYVNGQIGTTSVDKQILDEGDIVEWRLTEETKGGCGGSLRELMDLPTLLTPGNYHRKQIGRTPWYIA